MTASTAIAIIILAYFLFMVFIGYSIIKGVY